VEVDPEVVNPARRFDHPTSSVEIESTYWTHPCISQPQLPRPAIATGIVQFRTAFLQGLSARIASDISHG